MSERKMIKIRTFFSATIDDIKFLGVSHLRKKLDNIHVGTNDAPNYKNRNRTAAGNNPEEVSVR